ncbi:GNAT family N-acetyltransferase [Halobacillus sp. A5]|uniref:GNAT family N-acetyltransferase n=1 Tax=Halobacillus sp. A5 TaxID=2880263 RepID=UPI0020A65A53|nr:GNAT family N-acetyltransferase [Halobacillus sp. A5]MCP3026486.1 GNAT family N-acetyltransferase [Halobacillus sp. A5]
MNKKNALDIFHEQLRIKAAIPGYVREENEHVIRHVSQHNEEGFISCSSLTLDNAERAIEKEMAYFQSLGQRFEWKVYSYDQPDRLVDLLQSKGFTIDDREALMVMEINHNHSFYNPSLPLRLKEITEEAGVKQMMELLTEVWGESYTLLGNRLWRDKKNDPETLFLYGIYDGEKLVSTAWMYLEKGTSFASFWGGATLMNHRGQGCYSALLAVRAQKAHERGYRFLTVDASPMSQPILEKNGFTCLAYSYGCLSPEIQN